MPIQSTFQRLSNNDQEVLSRSLSPNGSAPSSPAVFSSFSAAQPASLNRPDNRSRTFWSADDECNIDPTHPAFSIERPRSPTSSLQGVYARSRPTSISSFWAEEQDPRSMPGHQLLAMANEFMRESDGQDLEHGDVSPPDYWTSFLCHGLGHRAPPMPLHGRSESGTSTNTTASTSSSATSTNPTTIPDDHDDEAQQYQTNGTSNHTHCRSRTNSGLQSLTSRRTTGTVTSVRTVTGVRMVRKPSMVLSMVADGEEEEDQRNQEANSKKGQGRESKERWSTASFKKTMAHLFSGRKANAGILERGTTPAVKKTKKDKKGKRVAEPIFVDATTGAVIPPVSPVEQGLRSRKSSIKIRFGSVSRRRGGSTSSTSAPVVKMPPSTPSIPPNAEAVRSKGRADLGIDIALANSVAYVSNAVVDSATANKDPVPNSRESNDIPPRPAAPTPRTQETRKERDRRVRRSSSWAGWAGRMEELNRSRVEDEGEEEDLDEATREARRVAKLVGKEWGYEDPGVQV